MRGCGQVDVKRRNRARRARRVPQIEIGNAERHCAGVSDVFQAGRVDGNSGIQRDRAAGGGAQETDIESHIGGGTCGDFDAGAHLLHIQTEIDIRWNRRQVDSQLEVEHQVRLRLDLGVQVETEAQALSFFAEVVKEVALTFRSVIDTELHSGNAAIELNADINAGNGEGQVAQIAEDFIDSVKDNPGFGDERSVEEAQLADAGKQPLDREVSDCRVKHLKCNPIITQRRGDFAGCLFEIAQAPADRLSQARGSNRPTRHADRDFRPVDDRVVRDVLVDIHDHSGRRAIDAEFETKLVAGLNRCRFDVIGGQNRRTEMIESGYGAECAVEVRLEGIRREWRWDRLEELIDLETDLIHRVGEVQRLADRHFRGPANDGQVRG